jgi:ATP-dependent protease ClpP protease subunit
MHKNNKNKNNAELFGKLFKPDNTHSYANDYGAVKEYYLSDTIGDPSEYVDWFHDIRNSRPTDVIKLHINCPGGNIFTTIQFLQALSETEAHIIASVEGACMSAATLIFLMADEYMITDHSVFLFHNYSSQTMGKGGEMYSCLIHERGWSERLFKDMYTDFLSEAEIKDMIEDRDIWMTAAEVMTRLEARTAAREAAEAAAAAPQPTPKTAKKSKKDS